MTFKYNEVIEQNILSYLQGWKIKNEPLNEPSSEEDETQTARLSIMEEAIEELDQQSTMTITRLEVELFWEKTILMAESYLQRSINYMDLQEDSFAVRNALEMWTAGALWKKYNLRVVDQEEDTNTIGYGDKLINNAKELLKPYSYFYVVAF